ncbi:MAG: hypothetical protein P8M80_14665 [Pirellulaceae bacterium]|nr:hypothetical protein [Pirellulaceae bacterium]
MSRRHRNDNPFTLFAFQDIITSVTGILILITLILALSLVLEPAAQVSQVQQDGKALQAELDQLESDIQALEAQTQIDAEVLDLLVSFGAESLSDLIAELDSSIEKTRSMLRDANIEVLGNKNTVAESNQKLNEKQQSLDDITDKIKQQEALLKEINESNRVVYQFSGNPDQIPWLIELGATQWLAAPANQKAKATVFSEPSLSKRLRAIEDWYKNTLGSEGYLVLLIRPDGVQSYNTLRSSKTMANAQFGVDLIASDVTVIDLESGAVIE